MWCHGYARAMGVSGIFELVDPDSTDRQTRDPDRQTHHIASRKKERRSTWIVHVMSWMKSDTDRSDHITNTIRSWWIWIMHGWMVVLAGA